MSKVFHTVKTRTLMQGMRKASGSTKEALRRAVITRVEEHVRPVIDKSCAKFCFCGKQCLGCSSV